MRTASLSTPSFTYRDFIQRCRQHSPSVFLPTVSSLPPETFDADIDFQNWRIINPWSVAAMTREIMVSSNEFRGIGPMSPLQLQRLSDAFHNSFDKGDENDPHLALRILIRHATEQFPSQESDFEEIARTIALYNDTDIRETKIIRDSFENYFEAPLLDVVNCIVIIWGTTRVYGGKWNLALLNHPELIEMKELVSDEIYNSISRKLTANQKQFRAVQASLPLPSKSDGLRWRPNALYTNPLLQVPTGEVFVPLQRLILRTIMPSSIYYNCKEVAGETYTSALGFVVEKYIGDQLAQVSDVKLLKEIKWKTKSGELASVDWILITKLCVILVESKSARLNVQAQMGEDTMVDQLQFVLSKATNQINETVLQIKGGNSAFADIPTNLPFLGIIVTAENLRMGNSFLVQNELSSGKTKTLVMSLRELEHLVPERGNILAKQLLAVANDEEKRTWAVSTSIGKEIGGARNPILDKAADRLKVFNGWRPVQGNT